jgi:Zinc-finger containing family
VPLFRHEPAALGHEETCKLWLENKCFNPKCTMRHMKIQVRKNRVQYRINFSAQDTSASSTKHKYLLYRNHDRRPSAIGKVKCAHNNDNLRFLIEKTYYVSFQINPVVAWNPTAFFNIDYRGAPLDLRRRLTIILDSCSCRQWALAD